MLIEGKQLSTLQYVQYSKHYGERNRRRRRGGAETYNTFSSFSTNKPGAFCFLAKHYGGVRAHCRWYLYYVYLTV